MTPEKPTDVPTQIAALWTAHHDELARHVARKANRRTTDPLVEDAITEAFIRAMRFLSRGGTIDQDAGAWLSLVAWREFLRLYARAARTVTIDLHDWAGLPALELETDELVLNQLQHDLDGALNQALARLTPRQRDVLTDNHAGYTYDEIAQRHGITWRAVNKAIQRARATLRNANARETLACTRCACAHEIPRRCRIACACHCVEHPVGREPSAAPGPAIASAIAPTTPLDTTTSRTRIRRNLPRTAPPKPSGPIPNGTHDRTGVGTP